MGKIHKFYYSPNNRDEWFALRQEVSGKNSDTVFRVGASDVASVCGMSKYKAPLNVFYEALGMIENKIESLRMSLGLVSESTNKLCYETYSPDEQVFAVQLKNRQKTNKINNANFIAVNEDFPYIFASLDFIRPSGQTALIDSSMYAAGEIIKHMVPVDAKNVTYQNYKSWNGGLTKNYQVQGMAQSVALGVKYAEMACKIEDSDYKIFPVVYDDFLVEMIKTKVTDFCQRVIQAKPLAKLWIQAKAEFDFETMAIYESLISNLQPDIIGIEAEVDALEMMYVDKIDDSLIADDFSLHHYYRYKKARRVEAIAKKVKIVAKANIVNFMGDYKKLNCGIKQSVTHYRTDKDKFYFGLK